MRSTCDVNGLGLYLLVLIKEVPMLQRLLLYQQERTWSIALMVQVRKLVKNKHFGGKYYV